MGGWDATHPKIETSHISPPQNIVMTINNSSRRRTCIGHTVPVAVEHMYSSPSPRPRNHPQQPCAQLLSILRPSQMTTQPPMFNSKLGSCIHHNVISFGMMTAECGRENNVESMKSATRACKFIPTLPTTGLVAKWYRCLPTIE